MSKRGRPMGSFTGKHPMRVSGKRTEIYNKWLSMLHRCSATSGHHHKYYGGRGISVCARWLGRRGFDNFVDDMGEPGGRTLDRKDNSKGYSPDNCRWATWEEQAVNRRKGGAVVDPKSLRQQALAAGLSYSVVYQRVKLHGWPLAKALATPKLKSGKYPRKRLTYANPPPLI